jgi:hypothetical protein
VRKDTKKEESGRTRKDKKRKKVTRHVSRANTQEKWQYTKNQKCPTIFPDSMPRVFF